MFDFFTVMPQPDIHIGGLTINEPVTAFTGLLIAVSCWIAYRKLEKSSTDFRQVRLMTLFFIFLGLSNVFGSIAGHAFYEKLGLLWKVPGWSLGMVAVGLVAQASIFRWNGSGAIKTPALALSILNLLVFSVLLYFSVQQLNFKLVEMYSAFGLIGIMLPLEIILHKKDISAASIWMLKALIPAVIAVALHIFKFSISPWFNFFDIGHVLLCGTVLYFFRSTVIMEAEK